MNNLVKASIVGAIVIGVCLVVFSLRPGGDDTDNGPAGPEHAKSEVVQERKPSKPIPTPIGKIEAKGRVVDQAGRVMTAANVAVYRLSEGSGAAARATIVERLLSDGEGGFTVSELAVGRYRFTAVKSGYQTATQDVTFIPDVEPEMIELTLLPGLAISGRVVDLDNQPIQGAEVRAFIERSRPDDDLATRLKRLIEFDTIKEDAGQGATTDSEGFYQITGLKAGAYRVIASANDHSPSTKRQVEVGSSNVDFLLEEGGVLRGVVNNMYNEPVSGAIVAVRLAPNNEDLIDTVMLSIMPPFAETTTDGGGEFEFRQLGGVSEYHMIVQASGYQPAEFEKVVVNVSSEQQIDVQLEEGATISGVVYDPEGRPLADARVKATQQGAPSGHASLDLSNEGVLTDELGQFSLDTLDEDANYRVVASHLDYATWSQNRVQAKEEDVALEIHLEVGGAIEGRVVDLDTGAPIVGTQVSVRDLGSEEKSGISDADGNFFVRGLTVNRRGEASCSFKADGYANLGNVKIPIENGSVTDGQLIELERNGSVSGVVVDAGGNPIPGVKITVERQHSSSVPVVVNVGDAAISAEDGTFTVQDVRSGEGGVVRGEHPGFLKSDSDPFDMEPGEDVSGVTLTMNIGGGVIGTIVDSSSGRPLAGVVVALRDDRLTEVDPRVLPQNVKTGDDGTFELGGIAPGDHSILIQADTYLREERDGIAVQEGYSTDLGEIALTPGTYIAGLVTDSLGNPITRAKVTVIDKSAGFRKEITTTNSAGEYRVDNLGQFPVDLDVVAKGYSKARLQEQPVNSENIDIVLERLGSITGQVFDESGAPITAFAVAPKMERNGRWVAPTPSKTFQSEDGRYTFSNLDPGTYQLGIGAPGYSYEKVYNIHVGSDLVTTAPTVTLKEGGKIAGYVVDETGAPVHRASISVVGGRSALVGMDKENPSRRSRNQGSATSDEQGYFELVGLSGQISTIRVSKNGYVEKKVKVHGGNQELTIELESAGAIRGFVIDNGEAIAGAMVYLQGPGGKSDRASTRRDGSFYFRDLPVGQYTLRAVDVGLEPELPIEKQIEEEAREREFGRGLTRDERNARDRRAERERLRGMDEQEREEFLRSGGGSRGKSGSSAKGTRKAGRGGKTGLAGLRDATPHRVTVGAGQTVDVEIGL